ncbi:MAG: MBL fold metallo-hydrolase [Proteobacteria bacterium]|nr:MBL fold metallo-hydrolase [Pseudomonadota bacterium]
MLKEIFPNLFQVKIPLPESPLRYLNSYVIKGGDRNLVIDTGFNHPKCLKAMQASLEELHVDLNHTDFFITHLHADHFGLVGRLVAETGIIYFNRPDKELLQSWEGFEPMIEYAGKNGFPGNELRTALHQHPGFKNGSDWTPELSIINDGDMFNIDDYHFACVQTPGHTMGHICLYEPDRKILIAGDHLLIDITPYIQCWSDDENPLKNYLSSLDKVYELEVKTVLPGHRRIFSDHRQRIDELKQHHAIRAEESLDILKEGPLTAFEVASRMTWGIRCNSWEEFPVAQRWFATGEAISHLRFLVEEGKICRLKNGNITVYALIKH